MTAPRWAVPVAALLALLITARLGWWQLDRAAQKAALQQQRDQRAALPPLQGYELSASADAAPFERRVELEGAWIDGSTIFLENRPMDGRQGFIVVSALLMRDGRTVAVQRGWLPRDPRDRSRIAPFDTASGMVKILGRVAPEPSRVWQLGEAASGPIRQNVELAGYARELKRPLLPLVVVQVGDESIGDGLLRNWPAPAVDVHKNHAYAFQWFALSALVVFLYVWFRIVRPRRHRAR